MRRPVITARQTHMAALLAAIVAAQDTEPGGTRQPREGGTDMGREVKRVSVGFDWPMGEVWHGYLVDEDEEWVQPPEGDGYQLWETVSEGSPISPVFPTPEGLADWMTHNDCTVNGPMSSYDVALRFVHEGWAPSFVSRPDIGLMPGVEWVGRERG